MTQASQPKSVPDDIRDCLDLMSQSKDLLTGVVREITWAYQDLQRAGQLPPEANGPDLDKLDKNAVFAEFATRVILPRHIDTIIDTTQTALDRLKALKGKVPPMPTTKKDDKPNG